jgi:hypothetical protein
MAALAALDTDGSGSLSYGEARGLFASLDLPLTLEETQCALESMDADSSGSISKGELRRALKERPFYHLEQGRFTVALTLREAEAVRASLHAASRRAEAAEAEAAAEAVAEKKTTEAASGGGGGQRGLFERLGQAAAPGVALRLGLGGSALGASRILDRSPAFRDGSRFQHALSDACLRFLDSGLEAPPAALSLLLWQLEADGRTSRLAFFNDVRACRRRSQHRPWEGTSLAGLFTTASALEAVAARALVARVKEALLRHGLYVHGAKKNTYPWHEDSRDNKGLPNVFFKKKNFACLVGMCEIVTISSTRTTTTSSPGPSCFRASLPSASTSTPR